MSEPKKIPERGEIEEQYTWRLEDLYPSDAAWEERLEWARGRVPVLAGYQGRLGESAATLFEYLTASQEAEDELEKLFNYAQRRFDEDTRSAEYQAMSGKIMALYVEISAALAFATPELLRLDPETLERFYQEEPELAIYRRFFQVLMDKKEHILSDAEEKLLAAAGEMAAAPDDIFTKLTNADLTFPDALDSDGVPHPVTDGTYVTCLLSPDRALRKNAFESMYAAYGSIKNADAAILGSQMKQLLFYANARKYPNTLAAALDGTRVPETVYRGLVDTVNGELGKLHRYVSLRKKLLKLDELHMYDIYTPMVSGVSKTISYEQAKEIVLKALAPLGERYVNILREGFENRWIDVYENAGKRSGAYSAGSLPHPYVLLNHKDDLDSVFILAHEMGHSLHTYLSSERQHPAYRHYGIFVAEVASTCNEALLMEYLLSQTTDKKERAYLINHFLDQFKGTLYRQTQFAEFELKLNELTAQGQPLTADLLCQEYGALNAKYYGPDMFQDPQISLEWARIPHFYYNYYVYQYSTGYAAAIALSRRILREGEPAVKDYLDFLSGGCSKDPIDLLKGAGVDMTSPQPIRDALALFDSLLDEMEKLMES